MEAKKKLKKWLKRNWYWFGREWPYKNITRIICEKFMEDYTEYGLTDYKLMCFDGKVKYIFLCSNRESQSGLNIDIYDKNWELTPYERPTAPSSKKKRSKPKNFDKMVKFAEKLSKGLPFLRVDFYEIKGKLYFGELTLYPTSGFGKFKPEEFDQILGNLIKLP